MPTSHLVLDDELKKLHDNKKPPKDGEWPGIYKEEERVSIKVLSQCTLDDENEIKVSAPDSYQSDRSLK